MEHGVLLWKKPCWKKYPAWVHKIHEQNFTEIRSKCRHVAVTNTRDATL